MKKNICISSDAQLCLTLCNPMDCSLPGSSVWDFPGQITGVSSHFLLQGIFLTQGSNTCLLRLLHWQADSLPLNHLGSPYMGCIWNHYAVHLKHCGTTILIIVMIIKLTKNVHFTNLSPLWFLFTFVENLVTTEWENNKIIYLIFTV